MILVTGGAGFLGSHVVCELVAAGAAVRVLERPEASVSHLPIDRVRWMVGDVRDPASVRRACDGCRGVIHLAANPQLWARDRGDFDAINHRGTENVLRAACDAGVGRIVHVSTELVVRAPPGASERVLDRFGPYCASKALAERVAFELAKRGAPIVVARPTVPVGPGDWGQSPPTRLALAFCRGQVPALLDCSMNLIDARDVALGLIAALERGQPGECYVLGGETVRLQEWLGMLGREIGRPAPRWRIPYTVALAAAHVSEFWANYVAGSIPTATVSGVRLALAPVVADPGPSIAELGVATRPLAESSRDAVRWYREIGWLPAN